MNEHEAYLRCFTRMPSTDSREKFTAAADEIKRLEAKVTSFCTECKRLAAENARLRGIPADPLRKP